MREMRKVTSILVDMELDTSVALVSDESRFSGSSIGCVVSHVYLEAAEGGPIAVAKDRTIISYDISNRKLDIEVSEAELKKRFNNWVVPKKTPLRYLARYSQIASSAD